MPRQTPLLLLVALLTAVSALEPTLVKSFLTIPDLTRIYQPMIQTKNAVIAYTIETQQLRYNYIIPQFVSMDIEGQTANLILEDTLQACGQGSTLSDDFTGQLYSRMYYHEATSTLVYYCTANNSLLIIDEEDYSVKSVVSTDVTSLFNETRLYAEGNSVVILGMGALFSEQLIFPQLIKIDLVKKTVVRQVTFNKNFGSGESVVAYASTNLLSFVLTTTSTQVTIYAIVFVGNFYTLTPLTTFSSQGSPMLYDLQILGNYLVTNGDGVLLLYDIKGTLVYTYKSLQYNLKQIAQTWYYLPNFAMRHGSSSLYVGLLNETHGENFELIQLTYQHQNVTSQVIISQSESSLNYVIALGNQVTSDLVFFQSNIDLVTPLTVIDLETLATIYTAPDELSSWISFLLTNSTYISWNGEEAFVYDLKSNQEIETIFLFGNFYYEQVNQVFYYFNISSDTSRVLMYYDVKTSSKGVIQSFPTDIVQTAEIVHAGPTNDLSRPNLILSYYGADVYSLLFYSEKHGSFNFTRPQSFNLIIPDYDSLSFFCLTSMKNGTTFLYNITKYQYDQATNTLEFQSTYSSNPPNGLEVPLIIDEDTIAIFGIGYTEFVILHLSSGKSENYKVPISVGTASNFKDNEGNNYIIFHTSNVNPVSYVRGPAYVFGPDKKVSQLPETDNNTVLALGSGTSYAVMEGYLTDVIVVNFYDVRFNDSLKSNVAIISK